MSCLNSEVCLRRFGKLFGSSTVLGLQLYHVYWRIGCVGLYDDTFSNFSELFKTLMQLVVYRQKCSVLAGASFFNKAYISASCSWVWDSCWWLQSALDNM